MTAVERRLAIIEVMSLRRSDTMGNLANEFDVCINTIKMDIIYLCQSFPIYSVRGKGGGVRVVDGWYIFHNYMTAEQTEFLSKLSVYLNNEDQKKLQDIIDKFSNPRLSMRGDKRR